MAFSDRFALVAVVNLTAGETPELSAVLVVSTDVPAGIFAYSTRGKETWLTISPTIENVCDTGANPGTAAYTLKVTGVVGDGEASFVKLIGSKPLFTTKF